VKAAVFIAAIGVATALVISGFHAGQHAETDAASERELTRLCAELERTQAAYDGEYWSRQCDRRAQALQRGKPSPW